MTFSAARTQATRGPWGRAVQGLESDSCTGEPGKDPSPGNASLLGTQTRHYNVNPERVSTTRSPGLQIAHVHTTYNVL